MRWAPWAAAFGSMFAAAASAGEEREPIRVEYSAPADCPDARAFLGEVLSRSSRVRSAPASELARMLRVTIGRGRRPAENAGEVSLVPAGDRTPVRFSATGTCEDVVLALAQFAALSIDASVKLSPTFEPLPENPYLKWSGPVAPGLPENPYRNWAGSVAESLPENPYRSASALPDNPYVSGGQRAPDSARLNGPASAQRGSAEALPANPYRRLDRL